MQKNRARPFFHRPQTKRRHIAAPWRDMATTAKAGQKQNTHVEKQFLRVKTQTKREKMKFNCVGPQFCRVDSKSKRVLPK